MNQIDLHIHSYYSADGELTPQEIVDMSKKQGLHTIALTDHNGVQGIKEALSYGKALGIEVIPGIEIDCTYKTVNLHVLGYYINWSLPEFTQLSQDVYAQGMAAFPRMIANLRKAGIAVDEGEVFKKAEGKVPCGELIGEVVLNKADSADNELLRPYLKGGARSNMPYLNFYLDFFAQGKPGYVPVDYMPLQDALGLIKQSNGISVLAHPGETLRHKLDLMDGIVKEGILGIEAFSSYHTPEQNDYFCQFALENKLLLTCGSDFHGKNKPGIKIGACHCTVDERHLMAQLATAPLGKPSILALSYAYHNPSTFF